MKRLVLLVLIARSWAACPAGYTPIVDTLTGPVNTGTARLFTGTVVISPVVPTSTGAITFDLTSATLRISGGAFSTCVIPNDAVTPAGTSYAVRYTNASGTWAEIWVVPTSVPALTIRAVRASVVPSPTVMFSPGQISQGGAILGQALVWSGTSYGPSSVAGGSAIWGGITGTLSAQTDLAAALAGKQATITTGTTGQYFRGDFSLATLPSQVYPGAGVANSTGSAWGTSYTVGTALNNLVQLNGSAQLPAVSAALLTNFPNVPTASALFSTPTKCSAGNYPLGIDVAGNAQNCTAASTGTVTTVSFTGGLITVANPTTTPALTVAGTSGGVPYFSGAATWASSAALALNGLVLGGGAGGAPTVTAADSTTTHALFATAGAPAFRAIAASDVPSLAGDASGAINTTQVTATHLAAALPVAQGGTATTSTLTGIVRGGNPFAAAELSGDVTTSGSNAATVVKVNGAVVPTSANLTSTNASQQLVAATAHSVSVPLTCSPAGASGTAYTCSTTPTFTPAANDLIQLCPDVANTGASTLVVNSQAGTPAIQKQQGQAALIANDLRASPACAIAQYNGTNWVLQGQTGNAAGGSSAFSSLTGGTNTTAAMVVSTGASIASDYENIGAVSTDGYLLENLTAAAVGAQQWSPRLHWIGQGWKTTATAASQQVEFRAELKPIQSATSPLASLVFTPTVNGVAKNGVALCAGGLNGAVSGTWLVGLDGGGSYGCDSQVAGFNGIGPSPTIAGNVFSAYSNGTARWNFTVNGIVMAAASNLMWSSSTLTSDATGDTGLARGAAGQLNVNDGSTTATNYRDLELRSLISGGTVPGISGCTAGTQTGGGTAGTYTSGTSGTCTVTLTLAKTAPTGWSCWANDITTPADVQHQSATTTTTVIITGTTVTSDVVNFGCIAY